MDRPRCAARLAALLVILLPCTSAAQRAALVAGYDSAACPSCASWNAPQPPVRLFADTWYVGTRGLSAILITSPDGHILIDGGLPNSAPLILENVRAAGFRPGDIKLILNSHEHWDLAGGIAALQEVTGARVLASAPSAVVLRRGLPERNDPQHAIALPMPAVREVGVVADGEVVRVGTLALTMHATGGHTPGGTSWTWRACEGARCLDFVYADSRTPISAPGFRFTDNPDYPTALADFARGQAFLERAPCDVLITPHPAAAQLWERLARGTDGLVDRGACARYAEGARRALEARLLAESPSPHTRFMRP